MYTSSTPAPDRAVSLNFLTTFRYADLSEFIFLTTINHFFMFNTSTNINYLLLYFIHFFYNIAIEISLDTK